MKRIIFSFVLLLLFNIVQLNAEGSVDFIDYPGHRLFLRADKDQQIKVYAEAGEFLNFGASHVGFDGGFISVYRPDGTLHQVYNGSNGDEAIIYNSTQELNGPTGSSAGGYAPGIIPVTAATSGVWSLVFAFSDDNTGAAYQNLLNNAPWTRAEHQPTNRRVILSWDVTVSKNNPLPNGGLGQSGRVFSTEYISMISQNGTTTSPRFYVLTKDGLQYSMDFMETDPFGFPISSSSLGLLNADQSATYQSWSEDILMRSDDPTSWTDGNIYQYDPQAEDYGDLINNKIFFNIPDPSMPSQALTTDIFHSNTHITWLFNEPEFFETVFNSFEVVGADETEVDCIVGDLQVGQGAHFIFDTNIPGRIDLKLDLNNDGDTNDDIDVILTGLVNAGVDSIFWDGNNGLGNPISAQDGFEFSYAYELRGGENHIMLSDVENNTGGIVFELLSDIGADATDNFYYDHTPVDGPVSGGGTPGNALPTNEPFTYDALFGNKKMLDYWAYVVYEDAYAGTITLNIAEDCTPTNQPDSDNDGIDDTVDLDDDNDGIPDLMEHCLGQGFACLPGGLDPSGDNDDDGIANYQDADDAAVNNNCTDTNADGICDDLAAVYDTDADGVPDHLDLDSDNDGISDLFEANHNQLDADNNGMIDGVNADFGANGFFNILASDADAFDAISVYQPLDNDGDGIMDADDLDSDNDGINDVEEAGHADLDNDGLIDNSPVGVDSYGVAISLNSTLPLPIDTDNDNIPDFHDLDTDNDGINDVEEGGNEDPDNDGHVGTGIPDVNEDGQPDGTTSDPTDTDMDGIPDYHDLDSDSDGILDVVEGGNDDPDDDGIIGTGTPIVNDMGQPDGSTSNPPDTDLDGIPDYQEAACTGADISILTTSGGGDFCAGDAIVLTATTNLTTGTLNFAWTSSNGSSFNGQATNDTDLTWTISPTDVSASGSYSLVVTTEEGCTATSPAIEVNVTAIPNQATISIEDTELCAGEDLILNTIAYTGQNVVYQWFANQNEIATTTVPSLTIENTTSANAGEYHVIIIDGNCASAPSTPVIVTVTEPIGDIEATNNSSANNAICTGGELTLSIPSFENATVEWFGPNGSVGTDFEITLTNVTSEDAGEYYAVVTFDVCGATNSAPTTVYISDNNITPVLSADNDEICTNESVELSVVNDLNIEAGDAVIYTWYNEQDELIGTTTENSILLENLTEIGEFYVSVSINGCSANSENYFINVNTLPNETANIPEDIIYLCEDEIPALLAVAGTESTGCWTSLGAAVVLNPNDNVTTVTLLEEGANLFVWTLKDDICGAFSSDTVTIYAATEAQAFDDLYTTEQNETTIGDVSANDNFSTGGDYEFEILNTPDEGTLSLNTDGTFEYTPTENFVGVVEFDYTICDMTCPDDCETANVTLNYQNMDFTDDCFVPNGITPNGDGANDALEIPCLNNNAHPNNNIMIFNRWGDKVYEESGYENDWYGTYNDNTLPAGTYFYILMIEPGSESIQNFFSIIY
jgi:gliding motility-associated-like protein